MKKQAAGLVCIILLIFGVSQAQPTHQEKERTLDRKSSQADQEALRNPVQISGSRSNGLCTVLFSWTGDAGYTMSATMTYDPSQAVAGVVGARGTIGSNPFNNGVIDLVVSFFDPDGAPLGTFVNVENGVVLYTHFLRVFFDINTEAFFGFLDVGQFSNIPVDGADDLNLWGDIGVWHELFDETGTLDGLLSVDFVIDVDDVACEEPVAVPVSSIAFLLLILPMLGFVFFRSRFVRA